MAAGYMDKKMGVKVGQKGGNLSPQNIPELGYFLGGNSWTAVKHTQ